MKKSLILHPFLFALFPVLFLYSHNVEQVSFHEVLPPAFIAIAGAFLLLVSAKLVLKDYQKSAIVVSVFLFLFFLHGHLYGIAYGWEIAGFVIGRSSLIVLFEVVIFAVSAIAISRLRIQLDGLTKIINVISIVLIAACLMGIGSSKIMTKNVWANIKEREKLELNTSPCPPRVDSRPDIYYLIFDRYPAADTLQKSYGYDNSGFIDYLTGKGFYVAEESTANYLKTRLSLASSLSMEYVNYLSGIVGKESRDLLPLRLVIQDNRAARFLKSIGYKYIHLGSHWEPTRTNRNADENWDRYSMPEFSTLLLQTTALYHLGMKLGFIDERNRCKYNRVLYKFDRLPEIKEIDGPVFVFGHFIIPHRPHVFDRDGNYVPVKEVMEKEEKTGFIDQLIFTNKKIKEFLDGLLAGDGQRPIIILQADEGPLPSGIIKVRLEGDYEDFDWKSSASREDLQEKFRIFNAYYLPGVNKTGLYPSITPVNSFRLLFNLYFHTCFKLLPDINYASTGGWSNMYNYFEVTEEVKY